MKTLLRYNSYEKKISMRNAVLDVVQSNNLILRLYKPS